MNTHKWFAIKTALFNAIGFSYVTAGITYVDARLTTHVVYGARYYSAGYWIAVIGGVVILGGTVLVIMKSDSWKLRAVLPATLFVMMIGLALPFFRPEFPHMGMSSWMLQLSVVSFLSGVIHFWPLGAEELAARKASKEVKLERVKEHANLWRTIAISLTVGYIAVIIPWSNFIWSQPIHIVTDEKQAFLLIHSASIALGILSLYMLLGVVYEAFLKAHLAADLMFYIEE